MLSNRELLYIDTEKPLDEQCQDILTNWEIVCEENDYHKDYVSQNDWDQWVTYRKEVDEELIELSASSVGDIHEYLSNLNYRIESARRVDMKAKWEEENKKSLEQEARELALAQEKREKEAKPSKGLVSKLLRWR